MTPTRPQFAAAYTSEVQKEIPESGVSTMGDDDRTIIFEQIPGELFNEISSRKLTPALIGVGFWNVIVFSISGETYMEDLIF